MAAFLMLIICYRSGRYLGSVRPQLLLLLPNWCIHVRHCGIVCFAPETECIFFTESSQFCISQNWVLLIGHRVVEHRDIVFLKSVTDAYCKFISVKRYLFIQMIGEEDFILDTKKSALCKHSPMLLDKVTEIFLESRINNNDCFTEHGTYLGSTDVKDISESSQIREHNVISLCHQTITTARTINEQEKTCPAAYCTDLF